MLRAYKTELKPNNKQASFLWRCVGTARFVYNWALADRISGYDDGKKINMFEQKRRFNSIKAVEFPWIYEIPYCVQEEEFRNLDAAYKNFFRRVKSGAEKPGFPKFKKRGLKNAFSMRGSIRVENDRVKLPIIGWVRLKERDYIPTSEIKILKATISERAGRWFISIQADTLSDSYNNHNLSGVIGIDVGIKSLAVLSDGTVFENPKALYTCERKLKRLQRELNRRKKGSSNREKTKKKISKLHMDIQNIRKHELNQVSHYITYGIMPEIICIEKLNVSGMAKNHNLAKAISDASMSELHRQIKYKAERLGIEVVEADRFYPSSKLCSNCGNKKDVLKLSERTYHCDVCGLEIDRDLNAAINLAAIAEPSNGRGLPVEL